MVNNIILYFLGYSIASCSLIFGILRYKNRKGGKKNTVIKKSIAFGLLLAFTFSIIHFLVAGNPKYQPEIPNELILRFEASLNFREKKLINSYKSELRDYAKEPFKNKEVSMAVVSINYGTGFAIPKSMLNKTERLGHGLNRLFSIEIGFHLAEEILGINGYYNDKWTIEKLNFDGTLSGKSTTNNTLNLCYFPEKDKIAVLGNLIGKLNKNIKYNKLLDLEKTKIKGKIGSLRMSSDYTLNLELLNLSTEDGLTLDLEQFENENNQFKINKLNEKWE